MRSASNSFLNAGGSMTSTKSGTFRSSSLLGPSDVFGDMAFFAGALVPQRCVVTARV
jgi:hypothetical protein